LSARSSSRETADAIKLRQELHAAKQAIRAANRELRSINVELEAAKEEIQSANQQLKVVNKELKVRDLQLDLDAVLKHSPSKIIRANGSHSILESNSAQELHGFGASLLMAQEAERRDLALELHDDLSQRLALLELNVGTLQRSDAGAQQLKQQLRSVQEQISSLSSSLRKIAYRLHPPALEDLGLAQAVQSYVRDFGEQTAIAVKFDPDNLPDSIDSTIALNLYRMVQESLRNVAEHSRASTAEVILSGTNGRIQLIIKDSGSGFEGAPINRSGLGLRSMEERARACGGTFKIASQPGLGTEIIVEVPEVSEVQLGNSSPDVASNVRRVRSRIA
jgi:signal transduction histidine kinase